MLPFRLQFRPGISLFEQVVYASKRAMVSGQLRPGDTFPSVRALSKELKINPNTAAKIVAHLIGEGLLENRPGIGTVVAPLPDATRKERSQLLNREIEELVVEAKHLGISLDETVAAIGSHWQKLGGDEQDGGAKKNDLDHSDARIDKTLWPHCCAQRREPQRRRRLNLCPGGTKRRGQNHFYQAPDEYPAPHRRRRNSTWYPRVAG